MKGKLNVFQRVALFWNKAHPYNAVHIVRIPRPFDLPRLEHVINSHLQGKGITGLKIDSGKDNYQYSGGPADIQIKLIDTQDPFEDAINKEVQRQLNTPFAYEEHSMTPFRFFVILQDDAFYLGLVYFHVVAGADSIIFLLKNIVNDYMDNNNACDKTHNDALDLYPATYRKLLPSKFKHILGWLLNVSGKITSARHAFKPAYTDLDDHDNGFSFFTIESHQLESLIETAAKWEVSVNDIFLGLVLMTLSPFAKGRRSATKRKNISVASIANIRRDLSVSKPEIFGIFLGYFSVNHPVPEGSTLEEISKNVGEQTKNIKKHKAYLRAIIDHFFALKLLARLGPNRQRKFYPKYFPLWAGITNVNLNPLWNLFEEKEPIDYIRAVSTGPVAPLVFSFTTAKDKLNIGVSYRTAVYSKKDIDNIMENFPIFIDSACRANG